MFTYPYKARKRSLAHYRICWGKAISGSGDISYASRNCQPRQPRLLRPSILRGFTKGSAGTYSRKSRLNLLLDTPPGGDVSESTPFVLF